MRNPLHQFIFKGMREWAVAYVVKQDGTQKPLFLPWGYFNLLLSQKGYRHLHQVLGPQGVVEPGVVGSGIYQVTQAHLGDPPKPLKIGMGDQVKKEVVGYPDKSVNWIIEDL
jgi:hypothetical protein